METLVNTTTRCRLFQAFRFSIFIRFITQILSRKARNGYIIVLPLKPVLAVILSFTITAAGAQTSNAIVTENSKPGNPESEWQIDGAGDLSIQGFATDISYNKGDLAHFKVKTNASSYTLKIYRLGYYNGNGARLQGTVAVSAAQTQPACETDPNTGLLDCGNWSESASWQIPDDAVSGVYIAKLTRSDTQGASHIVFIVRDDAGSSDLLFQTSDATWQAYNIYGDTNNNGKSLYTAQTGSKASKVSYNRPFVTRNGGGGGGAAEDWLFNAEYPMIRWLESNGYDVSYFTNVDTDRNGSLITRHKVFMSVGHDEYWSGTARANVEAARNAGKHLAFFSGNEIYWKTRWEASNGETHRTLVCYKEGTQGENVCNGECDPSPEWTGLWRDGCNVTSNGGCRPENALSGQISWTEASGPITVPATYKNLRFWRNTSVASLSNSSTASFTNGTIGYEWDPEQEEYRNSYPSGRILLSQTVLNGKTHHLSLYKHSSGALVFGAGTVQWSWGLDSNHDRGSADPSQDMRQATVNLFADMGVQPGSLQAGLVATTASSDAQAPTVAISSPTEGAALPGNQAVTISGTATDANVVAGVEISTDGGTTWRLATGTSSWTYAWTPAAQGPATIQSRAFDDSGNMSAPVTVNVTIGEVGPQVCPCTVFTASAAPTTSLNNDGNAIQLGMKFRASTSGYVTGVRFYKQSGNTGTHIGQLYSSTGTLLAQSTFTNETATGWQEVAFANPVAITANTTYIISYHSSAGHYSSNDTGFATAIVNGPLKGLANDEDGKNGVYAYSPTPAFPTTNFQSSNYFVDVVFNTTVGPDTNPPSVVATSPANNAAGVLVSTNINVSFDEALDPATVSGSTIQLLQGSTPVAGTVSYDESSRTATLNPTSDLSYSTQYSLAVKGGSADPRIKDLAGNALAANYSASFTTQGTPLPPPPPLPSPNQGPGGPILVISSSSNAFSRYPVEILRAEGFNAFAAKDISEVRGDAAQLSNYDVIVLGNIALQASDVTMLTDWVTAGGTLIAFRPDAQLASLLGLVPAGGTLSDKYLLVNTASGPGVGIVNETIQFHGAADLYTLQTGTTSLATLYSGASSATSNPAVTQRLVGTNGGKAIAFTYDLARSVVYTRQGNPAWAGQKRDGQSGPIRSDDMFFPDWVDLNKVAIPQADEQQRLLANIMVQGSRKPLPRFWYLPKGLKAAVIMTGDDHGSGGTKPRFDSYKTKSGANNTAQAVADWTAIRGTSYIYPNTPITDAEAAAYEAEGFEISLHLNTNCSTWTPTSLLSMFNTQLGDLATNYPSLTPPSTNRTHCISWSDWASEAKIQAQKGIRLDANYYYWPSEWITQDRPGMFTGSGMPMRFADLDGTLIDCYQATTQLTDESGIRSYTTHINTLLDNALGAKGYYGVFTANMHTDFLDESVRGSNEIIAGAQQRNVPVISAKQMLTWLDGRNSSSFGNMAWNGNQLSFSVNVYNGAANLQGMLPIVAASGRLLSLSVNNSPVNYRTEKIKGIDYAFFPATPGNYVASYDGVACTTPTATIAAVEPAVCPGTPVQLKLESATGQGPFDLVVNGATYPDVAVGQTFAAPSAASEVSIWSDTDMPVNADATDTQPIETGTKFRASVSGLITGIRFYKGATNTGTHVGTLWSATGEKLASATFINETASGWQTVRFATPVAIIAGTTYVASYYSPNNVFAYTADYFKTTAITKGPLTALQSGGTADPNGVYRYGAGGGFPSSGIAANYWVDVLFKEGDNSAATNYVLTSITDNGGCVATGESLSAVQVTVAPPPAGTLAAAPVQEGQDINLTFTATAGTGPFALVINGTNYPGVVSGTAFNTGVKASSSSSSSIWGDAGTPATASAADTKATEVGVKFRASIAGQITGIRFYKGPANTGTHTGSLWSSAGVLLASATFTNETATGWQEVKFTTPVSIEANTTYIASYFAPAGGYAHTGSFFTNAGVTNGPLKALRDGEDGANGVYRYSTGGVVPTDTYQGGNYWVDVVFTTSNLSSSTSFSLTSITDSKGCVQQGDLQVLTVQPTTTQNTAPRLAAIGPKSVAVPATLSFTATAQDDEGNALAFSLAGTVPAGAGISSAGAFSWAPTPQQVGSHTFNVVVSDGLATDEEEITVTVTSAPPTASACFQDQSVADFNAGTAGATVSVSQSANGGITLMPKASNDFSVAPSAAEWQSFPWNNGGTTTYSGGQAVVDGARFNTVAASAIAGPGSSLEFDATFGAAGFQHIGFGAGNDVDMYNNTATWAMFSTGNDASTGLKARVNNNGTATDVPLTGNYIGSSHRFRIDWNASSISFYVDGVLMQTTNVALSASMRVGISDYNVGGPSVSLDWVRLTPYASSGSFTSRIYDGSTAKTWQEATWTADTPAGTTVKLFQRQGNSTNSEDGTWTAFTEVANNGAVVGGASRFIQYRADLATTNTAVTPTLQSVGINCGEAACAEVAFTPATGTVLPNATVDAFYSQTITTNPEGYTLEASGLPAGLTLEPTTGLLSGKATEVATGAVITITATKGTCSAQATYTLTVQAANQPPVLRVIEPQSVPALSTLSFTATATDADTDVSSLTFSLAGTVPDKAVIDAGTGAFSWTPTLDQIGVHTFKVMVSDGIASGEQEVTVTVTSPAPTDISLSNQSVEENKPSATAVGTFNTASADATQTYSYSLMTGEGDTDNASFQIVGAELQTTAGFDFETKASYSIRVRATSSATNGATFEKAFTIAVANVNEAPVMTANTFNVAEGTAQGISIGTLAATDPDANQLLTYTITAGNTNDAFAIEGNELRVNNSAALDYATSPSFTLTVQATDSGNPALSSSATITVNVTDVNGAPIIADQSFPLDENSPTETIVGTVAASDPDAGQQLSYSITAGNESGAFKLEGNVLKVANTAALDYETATAFALTVQVSDDSATPLSSSAQVSVTLTQVNEAPVLTNVPTSAFRIPEQVEYKFQATATDPEKDVLTFSLSNAPAGAVISGTTGEFTWTPTEAQGGATYNFTVRVSDGELTAEQAISLIVEEVSSAPVLTGVPENATIKELAAYSFQAVGTDADNDPLTFSLVDAPEGAAINENGLFTWTPSEAQGPGEYDITVQVSDGSSLDEALVRLTVEEVNAAPVLNSIANATIPELTEYTFTASATDAENNPLTFSLLNAPAGATMNAGVFSWTPTEAQGPNTYTFSVQVSDGALTDVQELTLTVEEVGSEPVLSEVPSSVTIPELAAYTFTAKGTDGDGDALSYSLLNGPTGATIGATSGIFSWTPTEEQGPGEYDITVRLTAGGAYDEAVVHIVVEEANEAPVLAQLADATIPELAAYTFTAEATDAEHNVLTFSLAKAPAGATINEATGVFAWTPTEEQGPGTYTFAVQVSDGSLTDEQEITLTVTEVSAPIVLTGVPVEATIPELKTYTFTASVSSTETSTAGNTPTVAPVYSLQNAPTGASIDASSGVFTWMPAATQGPGQYTFTVHVAVGQMTDSKQVSLTVEDVVLPPTITSFTPTSGPVGTVVTITGTGLAKTSDVLFNGSSARFSISSDVQLIATVPAEATTGLITVTTPNGTATSKSVFTVSPTISAISPAAGPVGSQVVITGNNLQGATSVQFFNGVEATEVVVQSSTTILTTVPLGARTGQLTVTTPNGKAKSADKFTVTEPTIPLPVISSFSPASGPVGTTVTIFGSNLDGASEVAFNGTPCAGIISKTATDIVVLVPNGASSGIISVKTALGSVVSKDRFKVTVGTPSTAPIITSFSPASGPVGTQVSITGSNLGSQMTDLLSVSFNGTRCLKFEWISASQIKATVPAGAQSGQITVTTISGTATSKDRFRVTKGIATVSLTSGIIGDPDAAPQSALQALQVFPNPILGKAQLSFSLAKGESFTVDIYDLRGSKVRSLGSGTTQARQLTTVEVDPRLLEEGVYIVRLVTGSEVQTTRITIRK